MITYLLKENIEELDLISEYHLSKEPIRIDLLIIKEENVDEYYGAAEPPVRCGESHLSGLTEPLRSL